ncbi:putative proline utilization protein PrnX [Talaromyces proteolyticus]|uniref:Proline utilization protein PrnX n=1 Tax=Talaromyces proteolyticus TaxID=1131652 RepID=A0AAD4PUL3_9EURO|nr:putative proline utilization protein PrnX [Talaromyces proteolyticus]KAH8689522.1 putative proline utilization protein PrnX [Talaromyces proteolyticus]
MLVLPEEQLSELLQNLNRPKCELLLRNLSNALAASSAQRSSQKQHLIHQPIRSSIVTTNGDTTLFMPVSDTQSTGFKVVAVPHNAPIRGVINLLSPEGALLGVISAAEVTAFRTALATMTLFTRCTWISKKHVLVFGAGRQAEWHARLALLLCNTGLIEAITFINRSQDRLDTLMDYLLPDLQRRYPDVKISSYSKSSLQPDEYAARLGADLATSNVLFCCTPSVEPLFSYNAIADQNQRFISLIGSYKPHMQEIDSQTLLSGREGKIYVDSVEACQKEAGELIKAGVKEDQLIEIGDIFSADPDSQSKKIHSGIGNVVFKCVGMGIMDLVVAKTLLEMAEEKGLGTTVAF